MRKLPRRHPAFWLFERYQPYHRLLRMSPSQTRTFDTDGPELVVWRVGKGMQVGILASLAEVLAKHSRPTEAFADDVMEVLRDWAFQYPQWKGGLLDSSGVWGGEMEGVAKMRIEEMWKRHLWRQQRVSQLRSYVYAVTAAVASGGPVPSRKEFGLTSAEGKELRKRVLVSIDNHGHRFDPAKIGVSDLV